MTRLSTRHRVRLAVAALLPVAASLTTAAALPATAASVSPSTPSPIDLTDPALNDPDAPVRATFGVQPANTVTGNEQFAFDFGVAPGSQIFENAAVVNFAAEPVTLALYAADAFTTTDGEFGLGLRTDAVTGAGAWITIGDPTTQVEVPGQTTEVGAGRVFVPVTIAVPPNAEPGDHAAGITASLTTRGENPEGQNVDLEQRVALRAYIRVDGELTPGLTIESLDATYQAPWEPWRPGTLTVTGSVVNEGNVRLGYRPTVTVEGPFGLGRKTVTPDPILELMPRSRVEFTETVEGVWPLGSLRATLDLQPQAAPRTADPGLDPVSRTVTTTAVSWILVLIVIVAVALLVLLIIRSRRRSRGAVTAEADPERAATPRSGAVSAGV